MSIELFGQISAILFVIVLSGMCIYYTKKQKGMYNEVFHSDNK